MPVQIYRPRAALVLTVPLPKGGDWEPYTYTVPVKSGTLTINDHNQADTLSVSVDWLDAGVDPRWIAGATCELYLGDATPPQGGAAEDWQPSDKDLRFVGRLVKPARKLSGDKLTVDLEFHDYTSFFLAAKPFATVGIPVYTDTLPQAWARICENVPGVEELADNIRFDIEGETGDTKPWERTIGECVSPRFRKMGKLQVSPGTDAWAVWLQAVGAMGLLSYMDKDEVVVTTATDLYSGAAPPRFVYGWNIESFSEQRNNDFALRAVGLTSFDPLTGKTIEVIADPAKRTLKVSARKRKGGKRPKVKTDYSQVDFFQYPGVTDKAALQKIADQIWSVRSLQAIEGSLTTMDLTAETTAGGMFDLLSLRSGDTIEVRFLDTQDVEFVRRFESASDRAAYLVGHGYSPEVADIIAANVERQTDRASQFYVRSVETAFDLTGDGSFKITVNYINKIDPSTGEPAPTDDA